MPIGEVTTVAWADCDSGESDNCHITLDVGYNSSQEELDFEDWMSEHGWLYLDGEDGSWCVCPECRKLYHD